MRKWVKMTVAFLIFSLLPSQGREISDVIPAGVLVVHGEEREIIAETDMGESGAGETLQRALENMQETAAGYILLDTVENLIVSDDIKYLLPQLKKVLRPDTGVCRSDGELDAEKAWRYLRVHIPDRKLGEWKEADRLQILKWEENRFILKEPEDGQ